MVLRTAFTDLMGVRHPIASAPMGGTAGGALAAAVSEGGGLGLVGGGRADADWVERELTLVTERTENPWGIGFLAWGATVPVLELALSFRPHAVVLGFGDLRPFIEPVKSSGTTLIIQVTDMAEAEQAIALGADVIVAQGTESGGHGARNGRSTLTFVPAVLDRAGSIPVLAAGGIADGRGLAAILALGAAGALMGTRFQASLEALGDPYIGKAIVEAVGEDTERSDLLDIVRDAGWPSEYTARTLPHPILDEWRGRGAELAVDEEAKQAYHRGVERGDLPPTPVWASEAVDLIASLEPAADLVERLAAEAEAALARAAGRGSE
ncbi:NAD(P)H-dependent flavin oxidoreductase [Nocardia sp. CDC160]|uniref:NAD(P)H-dependent flavin oxidoreductase n=1 Tax=Nocardia sp. CDC160 TaxID=3112166 RepID=UPI002DBAADE2|nr:nitronate monooxygenase [Nocardia sp. CDC160]MEC3917992.1 nitronate monooxygenase [Nocardia sp. CDC160]